MSTLFHLVPRHCDRRLPVACEHRVAESLRAVGVRALADQEARSILLERHAPVERGRRRFVLRTALLGRHTFDGFHHMAEMLWRRAAAPADHRHTELRDETLEVRAESLRREVVVHLALDHRGESSVREGGDRYTRVVGEVVEGLVHLDRPGGAVHSDHIRTHRLDRGQRGTDLCAEQHAPGELDRDLDLDRYMKPGLRHRAAASLHRGFCL